MSSDLLAEFDSFYRAPQSTQPGGTSAVNDLTALGNTGQIETTEFRGAPSQRQNAAAPTNSDIWGDLGTTQPNRVIPQPTAPANGPWGSFQAPITQNHTPTVASSTQAKHTGSLTATQTRSGIVRRSTMDLFSPNAYDNDNYSAKENSVSRNDVPPKPVLGRQHSSGGDILFDAADEMSAEDENEFGEFETVTEPPAQQPPPSDSLVDFFGSMTVELRTSKRPKDLLPASNTLAANLPYPQAPKSPSFQERNPFSDLGLATSEISKVKKEDRPQSTSPVTAWPTFESSAAKPDLYQDSLVTQTEPEDEWGDFADLPLENLAAQSAKAACGIKADAWAWDSADRVIETAPPVQSGPPPTNIPPPSVLLALFPPLFDLPQSTLFKAVANQPFSLKNRIISDPSTITFLRAYLLIATVAARINAGRKLRWKRDTFLSQAMKIGPAAAGGKGGMKLTGVDKSEVTREDREAADVVRVWREQLGRLRSVVAVANTSIKDATGYLTIPEISEVMHTKTQEGALTAPKPCIICGLKRNERINKVDIQVEDSFGEWWIEHWGHRACRNFWQEHESKLKQR